MILLRIPSKASSGIFSGDFFSEMLKSIPSGIPPDALSGYPHEIFQGIFPQIVTGFLKDYLLGRLPTIAWTPLEIPSEFSSEIP